MKKILITILACLMAVLTITLTACGDDKNGTYYPTVNEMSANLEKNGYLTQFAVGERNSEGQGYVVDCLNATKGDEYIYFYWIEDAAQCKVYYDKLKELHPDSPHFVLIENDEKFGNIVYCGTENAINAAGIKVVEVKVKV
mgnify:CR=1 FL=1